MPDQVQLTPSEKATLIAALERALLVAAKARSVDHTCDLVPGNGN